MGLLKEIARIKSTRSTIDSEKNKKLAKKYAKWLLKELFNKGLNSRLVTNGFWSQPEFHTHVIEVKRKWLKGKLIAKITSEPEFLSNFTVQYADNCNHETIDKIIEGSDKYGYPLASCTIPFDGLNIKVLDKDYIPFFKKLIEAYSNMFKTSGTIK